MTRYNQPRSINWVSILLLVLAAGGVYAGYKLVPVWLIQPTKVDKILDDEVSKSGGRLRGANPSDVFELAAQIRDETYERVQALGIHDVPGHPLEVGYAPAFKFIYVKYRVVVPFPFGKSVSLDFLRKRAL